MMFQFGRGIVIAVAGIQSIVREIINRQMNIHQLAFGAKR